MHGATQVSIDSRPLRAYHRSVSNRGRHDMTKAIPIWIFGMLASGIFGGLIGHWLWAPIGQPLGSLGGIFAFACLRLWLTEGSPADSER